MKLISMTTFIEHQNMEDPYNFKGKVLKYSRFLKQHLKLEMFVPCDNGEPLPVFYSTKWYKAKEKVLFEGNEIQNKLIIQRLKNGEELIIDDLVKNIFELTPNATKQFL